MLGAVDAGVAAVNAHSSEVTAEPGLGDGFAATLAVGPGAVRKGAEGLDELGGGEAVGGGGGEDLAKVSQQLRVKGTGIFDLRFWIFDWEGTGVCELLEVVGVGGEEVVELAGWDF